MTFITRLSREARGKDFRVISTFGGYDAILQDLEERLLRRHVDEATFEINVQRDYDRAFLRITVTPDILSRDGEGYRFDGAIGEFLDFDGHDTGNKVSVRLSIYPRSNQEGQTAGVLRMEYLSTRNY